MPTQPINVIQETLSLEELSNELAKLQKILRYLLNGQLDFENITARGIKAENIEANTITTDELAANSVATNNLQANAVTADKISVSQLSAITANLGTITAGLLQAVSIISATITGGTIQTTTGSYPRIELSSATNIFKAEKSSSERIQIIANDVAKQAPLFSFRVPSNVGETALDSTTYSFSSLLDVLIGSLAGKIELKAPNGVYANGIRLDV